MHHLDMESANKQNISIIPANSLFDLYKDRLEGLDIFV